MSRELIGEPDALLCYEINDTLLAAVGDLGLITDARLLGGWRLSIHPTQADETQVLVNSREEPLEPSLTVTFTAPTNDALDEAYAVAPNGVVSMSSRKALNETELAVLQESLDNALASAYAEQHVPGLRAIQDRRVAMRRCIGPLVIANGLLGIQLVQNEVNADPVKAIEKIEQEDTARLALEWARPKRNFKTNVEATAGLAAILSGLIGFGFNNAASNHVSVFSQFSRSQELVFNMFTSDQAMDAIMRGTLDGQSSITATIALPAFIAAKHDIHDPTALLVTLNTISLDEICDILESDAFIEAMGEMPLAPNATFSDIVDCVDIVKMPKEIVHDEQYFEVDADRIEVISPELAQAARESGDDDIDDFAHYFSTYTLFAKNPAGVVTINPEFVRSARAALRFESKHRANKEYLTPTMGCPALIKSARIEQGDITTEQLSAMTTLSELGIGYDPVKQKLTFALHVIEELHKLHVASLRAFIARYAALE